MGTKAACWRLPALVPAWDEDSAQAVLQFESVRNAMQERVAIATADYAAGRRRVFAAGIGGSLVFLLLMGAPVQQRQADIALQSSRHLLSLIDEVLDFSRLDAGRLELADLAFGIHELVSNCVDTFVAAAQCKSLMMCAEIGAHVPPELKGESQCLRQVLLNLIGNADKYTDSGRVGVRVRDLHGDAAGTLRVEVVDTGMRISSENLQAVFEKFTVEDASDTRRLGGVGLDLALSRQLIELMGGAIGVESEPGKGSCFWFELPLGPAAAEASLDSRPAGVEGEVRETVLPATMLRVLLVEDDEVNCLVAGGMLERLGHDFAEAGDGAEAAPCTTRSLRRRPDGLSDARDEWL